MPYLDPLLVIAGLGLFMIIFWPLTLVRAIHTIMTHAFFGANRPMDNSEFRRFLLSAMLMMAVMALALVLVAPVGKCPHLEYREPVGLLRLLISATLAGLFIGASTWALFRWQMKRQAKFHRPDPATWKGHGFWGPRKRKMTSIERETFLRRMDLVDYLNCVCMGGLVCALLPLFLLVFSLIFDAPFKGFIPVLQGFTHLVFPEIVLVILGFSLASILWVISRFFVWLGWTRTYA